MSEAKHAPGPWCVETIEYGEYGDAHVVSVETHQGIAIVQGDNWGVNISDERLKANADLIAAAPDGLALAEMVIAWSNGLRHRTAHEAKMVDAAFALRTKATGG